MIDAAASNVADAEDRLVQRQLQRLDDLAEIGLEVARAVERQARTVQTPADANAVAMAYARVSRAVRQTILLQSKLLGEAKTRAEEDAELEARLEPGYAHKFRVERIVERLAKEAHGDDEDEIDRLVIEAGERLDDEDLYGDVLERPIGELVALLCRDLGLDPDWTRLAQEAWAIDEIESGAPGSPFGSSPLSGGERERRPGRAGGGLVPLPTSASP